MAKIPGNLHEEQYTQIFLKFDIWVFSKILSRKFKLHYNQQE